MSYDELMSREHPILFSAPMVRAILGDRKTQTRRIVTGKPLPADAREPRSYPGPVLRPIRPLWVWMTGTGASAYATGDRPCPHGAAGDRLWVRETWCSAYASGCWGTIFAADGAFVQGKRAHEKGPHFNADDRPPLRFKPSIHMPRWASRITLEITGVRVERLNEISEADAKAEGVEPDFGNAHTHAGNDHRRSFERLWDTINGKRAPWASNPWVWVVEFRRTP